MENLTFGIVLGAVLGSGRIGREMRSASTPIIVRNAGQVTDSNDT
jgi:hypothetical protein